MPKTTKATATGTTKQRPRKTDRKSATRRQAKRALAATASPANAKAGSVTVPIRQSKKAAILGLLERPDGAAISDLTAATGWQVHSVRAALTCHRAHPAVAVPSPGAAPHSTRQIDWTSAADGACMPLVARGRSEPRVPQPQPVVPTGLVAVTAPGGAGTPEGGSDQEAISQYSRGQERRPRGAQAKVDPQIIHAAQDERAGYRSQGAVRRHATSADPGYRGARPSERGRGDRAAAPARGSLDRRGRRRDGMAAAHRPRSLLRDAEEETRSDPELGSGAAWPRLPHDRHQRSGRRCRTFGRAETIRRRCGERRLMPQDRLDRIREA